MTTSTAIRSYTTPRDKTIVEAVLDPRHDDEGVTLDGVMKPPAVWDWQLLALDAA